jgi:hypothetical protein
MRATDHEIGQPGAAIPAPPPDPDQRHVAAAIGNQRGEIGVLGVLAGLAPDMEA